MVVDPLEHRDRRAPSSTEPTARQRPPFGRRRPRRGAGRSRRPGAAPRRAATYTGRRATPATSASASCCAGVTSTERTVRPDRRSAATTSGDSAMKKPRSASTRRRSVGIGRARRSRTSRGSSGVVRSRSPGIRRHRLQAVPSAQAEKTLKNRPGSLHRRASTCNDAPRTSPAPRWRTLVNRSQLLNKFAEDNEHHPQGSRRVRDLAPRHHHRRASRAAKTLRSRASRSSGASTVPRASLVTPRPARRCASKAKRVARITPLKNFKDAVLSGKAMPRSRRKKAAAKKAPAKKAPAEKKASGQEDRARRRRPAEARQAPTERRCSVRSIDVGARAECPGSLAFTLPSACPSPSAPSSCSASGCR